MDSCAEKGCPALATRGVYCPIHASGLRKYEQDNARCCGGCGLRLKTGTWIKVDEEGRSLHYPACKKSS